MTNTSDTKDEKVVPVVTNEMYEAYVAALNKHLHEISDIKGSSKAGIAAALALYQPAAVGARVPDGWRFERIGPRRIRLDGPGPMRCFADADGDHAQATLYAIASAIVNSTPHPAPEAERFEVTDEDVERLSKLTGVVPKTVQHILRVFSNSLRARSLAPQQGASPVAGVAVSDVERIVDDYLSFPGTKEKSLAFAANKLNQRLRERAMPSSFQSEQSLRMALVNCCKMFPGNMLPDGEGSSIAWEKVSDEAIILLLRDSIEAALEPSAPPPERLHSASGLPELPNIEWIQGMAAAGWDAIREDADPFFASADDGEQKTACMTSMRAAYHALRNAIQSTPPAADSGRKVVEDVETLRDRFAMRALNGWLASFAGADAVSNHEQCALFAYRQADAMLRARVTVEPVK